jgi:hypothetical protein
MGQSAAIDVALGVTRRRRRKDGSQGASVTGAVWVAYSPIVHARTGRRWISSIAAATGGSRSARRRASVGLVVALALACNLAPHVVIHVLVN